MAKVDPLVQAHLEWLGFVQPTGLVVSAPALVKAGAILDRRDADGQRLLREVVEQQDEDDSSDTPWLPDFEAFASSVLDWGFSPKAYAGTKDTPIPAELEHALTDYDDTLRPSFAVREMEPDEDGSDWQLLVRVLDKGQGFDEPIADRGKWEASPHSRLERLLRETNVQAGLLFNGESLRLMSAPYGESSGWLDFEVAAMMQTAGRPICTALRLLLRESRLLAVTKQERLAALLQESRKYQNEVSEKLADQVLHGLYELLRGFQAAHDQSKGELLRETLVERPNDIYHALLTVILRLVFLLYAEERGMLPENEVFQRNYSLASLHKRLQEDAALFPDTMDQRFGAWAQLVVLFRMVFDGADCGDMKIPRRHGELFDPDRFPFLEGRPSVGGRQKDERIAPPLVPDGAIFRALEDLLVLDGERISYRALDVEQIGSVYETMMGFRLETATGRSVAVKSPKKRGAPTVVDLDELVDVDVSKRSKWVQDNTERKLSPKVLEVVKDAENLNELHAALHSVIDTAATPDLVPPGAMILQPSEERRKSGSHYTPRELTKPIVETTLDPILKGLREEAGGPPTPEQILDLKVCDPAMGSGAFLVEACRQLGEQLREAWKAHDARPEIPEDDREEIYAQRLVAQKCLYGVDRNPVAVDLAKVSLWLATLAKDHPLTFIDHALRHGDSLVGLSRRQLESFHWEDDQQQLEGFSTRAAIDKYATLRRQIQDAGEDVEDWQLRDLWDEAQAALSDVRLYGDLVIAAFFEGNKAKEREAKRNEYENDVLAGNAEKHRARLAAWREADQPLVPFHWEIEFPEVLERKNSGFDAMMGNPPFLGGRNISRALGSPCLQWLLLGRASSGGQADLVSYFFLRAFTLLRSEGALGLIATNTIAQGDTRARGLRWICQHGGEIYAARRRVKWPGLAAVMISVLHIAKGTYRGVKKIDGREVEKITAFLFEHGGHEDPAPLSNNAGLSFKGVMPYGMGFTFDDTDSRGVASSLADMRRLIAQEPRNAERILPYIGGEEINTSPTHAHHRYVIDFGSLVEAEARRWPSLMEIVEQKVKPERMKVADNPDGRRLKQYWWRFGRDASALYAAIASLKRVLATPQTSKHRSFTFLPGGMVYDQTLTVFALPGSDSFCILTSRVHEVWTKFFGTTLEDRLRYTPTDCFETFPFPQDWENASRLEVAGKEYYEYRAGLMVRNDEGLTKTYNRFHDPNETDPVIEELRELHAAMDRAVLDSYGWTDIPTDCKFLLDYEIDEEEWGNKKKPWRYRWPEEVHDEVLARLLELNSERAAEEARSGSAAKGRTTRRARKKKTAPQAIDTAKTMELFP